MALRDRRRQLIDYIKSKSQYLQMTRELHNIYDGNLLPYVDNILQNTLSAQYYNTIRHRNLPINILQRYTDKVSTVYNTPPKRETEDDSFQEFIDFYVSQLEFEQAGIESDVFSNLFKCYALEPYVLNGEAKLRVLAPDSFLVYSDNVIDPTSPTIFLKFCGQTSSDVDSTLIFAYTDNEFDAFYLSGMEASQYLVDNQGLNDIGTIPFLYGNRQRSKLIPVIDSDMLQITKAIPCMMCDGAGAQFYQSFSVIYGIDLEIDKPTMSPNIFWNMKSDRETNTNPSVGTIQPTADTDKVMEFITKIFIFWLETKGVRVGSIGTMDTGNTSSGIAKIIDEMDVYNIIKKSSLFFQKEEQEFWNKKMPLIHNYWLATNQINAQEYPPMLLNVKDKVYVTFEKPQPMMTRNEIIANCKSELELKTMTPEQAIKQLHPDYEDDDVQEVLDYYKTPADGEAPEENNQGNQENNQATIENNQNQGMDNGENSNQNENSDK